MGLSGRCQYPAPCAEQRDIPAVSLDTQPVHAAMPLLPLGNAGRACQFAVGAKGTHMQDILTITLNPAVDLSTSAAAVTPGPKLRCDAPVFEPGGGGINVSRAIRNLGGQSRAFVATCGAMGAKLEALLAAENIPTITYPAPGETRQSVAVTDRQTGAQYRFVLPGPEWTTSNVADLLARIGSDLSGGYVVLSGSQPPGIHDGFATQLCEATAQSRLIVDTSGTALIHLATGASPAPYLLRMDSEEAEALAGRSLPDRRDSAAFAAQLVNKGAAQAVVIARGADGSVLAAPNGLWHACAADVPVRSKIGAGDSFVGGMVLALARGLSLPQALQRGAAAASAAVMTDGTQLCTRADADALVDRCTLTQLPA